MLAEKTELEALSELCDRDRDILNERIVAAERVIDQAKNGGLPSAKELVVPSCVLHQQLYDVVTEDAAIEDTLYALGRRMEWEGSRDADEEEVRGRVEAVMKVCSLWPEILQISELIMIQHIRSLAREQWLKRALAMKIAEQLGLQFVEEDVDQEWERTV